MQDWGLLTIFLLAVTGMAISIFGIFPANQVDFPEHEDPPEESE